MNRLAFASLVLGRKVIAENLDTGEKTVVDGELEIVLKERRSSVLFTYAP